MIRTVTVVCSTGVFVGLVTVKAVYVGAKNLVKAQP